MLADPLWKEKCAVALGLLFSVYGIASAEPAHIEWQPVAWYVAGAALEVWGLGRYARCKGYSRFYGLLGLLHLPGVVVLKRLPDQSGDPASAVQEERNWVQ